MAFHPLFEASILKFLIFNFEEADRQRVDDSFLLFCRLPLNLT